MRVSRAHAQRGLAPVRWCAALVAAASAGVHVLALATGAVPSSVRVVVLLAMAAACLPCAVHLVLLPRRRAWLRTAVVSAAMLGAHPLLPAGTGHHGTAQAGPGAVAVAMVALPVAGLVLALTGLALGAPRRTGPVPPA
ncbi:hypothetical protein [Geodermatophilus sp. CPCC 206100]|uniref:hypothetical protein n=1 Tax=Geodermatophilus sp. CPCC 206100 TaxID=3020054 RepID=UPI003B00C7E2